MLRRLVSDCFFLNFIRIRNRGNWSKVCVFILSSRELLFESTMVRRDEICICWFPSLRTTKSLTLVFIIIWWSLIIFVWSLLRLIIRCSDCIRRNNNLLRLDITSRLIWHHITILSLISLRYQSFKKIHRITHLFIQAYINIYFFVNFKFKFLLYFIIIF